MAEADNGAAGAEGDLHEEDYRALAGFRCELRKFMAFSAQAAKQAGVEPQQYQAMLAIRAQSPEQPMGTSALAQELFISVSAAVELIDRLERAGLAIRRQSVSDRRRTMVTLTPKARRLLNGLAGLHRRELQQHVPALMALLGRIARPRD